MATKRHIQRSNDAIPDGIYCIIFDGYSGGPSTKDHEHERRKTGKSCADINRGEIVDLC